MKKRNQVIIYKLFGFKLLFHPFLRTPMMKLSMAGFAERSIFLALSLIADYTLWLCHVYLLIDWI
jgi:hypothetical protein